MEESIYPPSDSQFPKWIDNFTIKVEPLIATLGISTTEYEKLLLVRNALVFCDDRITVYDEARLDFVSTRQTILYGDETNELLKEVEYEQQPPVTKIPAQAPANSKAFVSNLVKRIRLCPSLNENQKKELGVLTRSRNVPEVIAVLKGEAQFGLPGLEVKLLGQKGFEVWRRVTGTGEFAYFDRSASSTYTDNSELPAGVGAVQYDYQVRLIGAENEPVSDFSNFVTLTKRA